MCAKRFTVVCKTAWQRLSRILTVTQQTVADEKNGATYWRTSPTCTLNFHLPINTKFPSTNILYISICPHTRSLSAYNTLHVHLPIRYISIYLIHYISIYLYITFPSAYTLYFHLPIQYISIYPSIQYTSIYLDFHLHIHYLFIYLYTTFLILSTYTVCEIITFVYTTLKHVTPVT